MLNMCKTRAFTMQNADRRRFSDLEGDPQKETKLIKIIFGIGTPSAMKKHEKYFFFKIIKTHTNASEIIPNDVV